MIARIKNNALILDNENETLILELKIFKFRE